MSTLSLLLLRPLHPVYQEDDALHPRSDSHALPGACPAPSAPRFANATGPTPWHSLGASARRRPPILLPPRLEVSCLGRGAVFWRLLRWRDAPCSVWPRETPRAVRVPRGDPPSRRASQTQSAPKCTTR